MDYTYYQNIETVLKYGFKLIIIQVSYRKQVKSYTI